MVHRDRGRNEHYDFRLEVGGVLKSWAVVELRGHKLRGGYALARMDRDERGRERWLLVKKREADPGRDPLSTQPESVLSGRTLEQVAAELA